MRGYRIRGIFLLVAAAISPPPAQGQITITFTPAGQSGNLRERSHIPLPKEEGATEDLEELFDRRLRRTKDLDGMTQLARDMLQNPEKFPLSPELRDQIKKSGLDKRLGAIDFRDPVLRDLLEKMMQQQGADPASGPGKLSGEHQDLLNRFLKIPKEEFDSNPNPAPDPGAAAPDAGADGGAAPGPGTPAAEAKKPEPKPEPSPWRTKINDELVKFAKRFRNSDAFQNSRTLQNLVQDLAQRQGGRGDPQWLRNVERLGGQLPDVSRWDLRSRLPFLENMKLPSRFAMPRLPQIRWTGVLGSGLPSLGGPGGGLPSGSGGGRPLGLGMFWVFVVGVVGFVLWYVLLSKAARANQGGRPGWRLGPWPVNPGAVRTPEELVQAFEYLAVLLFGPAARSWNHRAIAERLAQAETNRQAASVLADLYERVRYAPPGSPPGEEDFAAARRHLGQLAGVPSA